MLSCGGENIKHSSPIHYRHLVNKVLDMKLKTLIAATVVTVFLVFAGIYYNTLPTAKPEVKRLETVILKHKSKIDNLIQDSIDLNQLGKRERSVESQNLLKHVPPASSILQTNSMPEDKRLWPSVGNGLLGTVVNTGHIYMTGLYTMEKGNPRRASIPDVLSVEFSIEKPKVLVEKTFTLNMGQGIFNETTTGKFFTVTKLTFAHRTFKELFIVELKIDIHDHPSREPFIMKSQQRFLPKSDDIEFKFGNCEIPTISCSYIHGVPHYTEASNEVHVYYTNVPDNITMANAMTEHMSTTYIMSISQDAQTAKRMFEEGLRLNARLPLRRSHIMAWSKLWSEGAVDLEGGNSNLAQLSYSSLYYMLSSLPLIREASWPHYGIASDGLAQYPVSWGEVTGDSERWIFPPLLFLHSNLSKGMLDYRAQKLPNDKIAEVGNHFKLGYFPWSMTTTGKDVTSRDDRERIYHNGDISVAVEQYLWLTNDTSFLTKDKGKKLITAIAFFWNSRMTFDSNRGVIPPGELSQLVSNSFYTNTVAKASINLYSLLSKDTLLLHGFNVDKILIPFQNDYQPAFENFSPGSLVIDPEVILLNPHLSVNLSTKIRKNNLKIYEKAIESTRSQMTLAAFVIQFLELKDTEQAEKVLTKMIEFVKGPFKVWSKFSDGTGLMGFLPGMASYQQVLLFGYAGLRVQQHQLTFDPVLPSGVSKFTIRDLDYLDQSLTFTFYSRSSKILLKPSASKPVKLVVIDTVSGQTFFFQSNNVIYIPAGVKGSIKPFSLYSRATVSPTRPYPKRQIHAN